MVLTESYVQGKEFGEQREDKHIKSEARRSRFVFVGGAADFIDTLQEWLDRNGFANAAVYGPSDDNICRVEIPFTERATMEDLLSIGKRENQPANMLTVTLPPSSGTFQGRDIQGRDYQELEKRLNQAAQENRIVGTPPAALAQYGW